MIPEVLKTWIGPAKDNLLYIVAGAVPGWLLPLSGYENYTILLNLKCSTPPIVTQSDPHVITHSCKCSTLNLMLQYIRSVYG